MIIFTKRTHVTRGTLTWLSQEAKFALWSLSRILYLQKFPYIHRHSASSIYPKQRLKECPNIPRQSASSMYQKQRLQECPNIPRQSTSWMYQKQRLQECPNIHRHSATKQDYKIVQTSTNTLPVQSIRSKTPRHDLADSSEVICNRALRLGSKEGKSFAPNPSFSDRQTDSQIQEKKQEANTKKKRC